MRNFCSIFPLVAAFGLTCFRLLGAESVSSIALPSCAEAATALQQARTKAKEAENPSATAEQKVLLRAEARRNFEEARRVLEVARTAAAERLKQYASRWEDPKDPSPALQRRQARAKWIEISSYLAGILYETAKTFRPQSAEYRTNLDAAIRIYEEVFEKFPGLAGGLYARMWDGRLCLESGRYDRAIEIFQGMLNLPENDDAFRQLRDEATVLLLEAYTRPEVKKYSQALQCAEAWTRLAREGSRAEPDALRIQYMAGRAALEHARTFHDTNPHRSESLAAARKNLEFVARQPGSLQGEAMRALTDPLFGEWSEESYQAATWAEARWQGDFAWQRMTAAQAKLRRQAAEKKNQGVDYENTQWQFSRACREALRQYARAVRLMRPGTSANQKQEVRFRLCWLYWAVGDSERSAVVGEFLARRYPQRAEARPAGEIAAKAYRSMIRIARSDAERKQAVDRLETLADFLARQWPGSPEADTAWMMLIDTAAERHDGVRALACLARIPAGSPRRSNAEERAGRAGVVVPLAEAQTANKP